MLVEMLVYRAAPGRAPVHPGDKVELPDAEAQALIAAGNAKEVTEKK